MSRDAATVDETAPSVYALPAGWCWTEFGPWIAHIEAGKSFKCEERPPSPDEVGVVKVSSVTWGTFQERESKTCTNPALVRPELYVRRHDFLFSRANTIELVGACVVVDGLTHQSLMLSDKILRFAFTGGDPKWFLWVLRTAWGRAEIQRLATGNQESMRNIGQERIRKIRVPVAPLAEQKKVVDYLETEFSRLDAAVAGLKRVQANLKRYRASVLKAAVEGRLVPTEAELARERGRTYEPASELLARILKERRARWEAAELASMKAKGKPPKNDSWKSKYQEPTPPNTKDLPGLPEGWCWATVDQLGAVQGGIQKGKKRNGSPELREVPYLRVANVQRGFLDLGEVKTILASPEEIDALRLEAGDVLFNEGGDRDKLGRGWVWNNEVDGCIHQNHVFRARLYSTEMRSKFLSWYGNGSGQKYFFDEGKQTTNLASLNSTKLRSLPVPVPPAREQLRVESEMERLLSETDASDKMVERSVLRCARLRQSILKWAFEGKLVDQDPNDEPASALLARIRAERGAAIPAKKTRSKDAPAAQTKGTPNKRQRKKAAGA